LTAKPEITPIRGNCRIHLTNSLAGQFFAENYPSPAHNRNSEPARNTALTVASKQPVFHPQNQL
jgi:hypothetical protein